MNSQELASLNRVLDFRPKDRPLAGRVLSGTEYNYIKCIIQRRADRLRELILAYPIHGEKLRITKSDAGLANFLFDVMTTRPYRFYRMVVEYICYYQRLEVIRQSIGEYISY
jgi:hypothetical protein